MSTSPTKSESGFASPTFQPPRRGHRRGVSSAISTNDLPLLPPPVQSLGKGGSAPTSPTNFGRQDYMSLDANQTPSNPPEQPPVADQRAEGTAEAKDADKAADEDSPKPVRSGTRARVGFSDTLEYIPRPLSMVSSDASSIATTRPGHSVSESLSSVMSATPNGRDSPALLSRSPTREMTESRPSTAGAILEGLHDPKIPSGSDMSPRRRNSIPALLDVADAAALTPPTPSPTKPKRWSFFGLDPFVGSGSPTKARPCSSSSSDSTPRAVSAGSSSEHGSDSPFESAAPSKHKKSKKGKKKKVKGWAGVILPRKPKSQSKRKANAVRPPTPPPAVVPPEDEDEEMEVAEAQAPELPTPTVTITESASPPRQAAPAQNDPSYNMIDLDAALGPFNTPLPHNPEWEAAQRAAGNVGKRRLHSAQGMKGFSGPGMHYHRRAESAPALPPFDPGRSSLHRFGSNSTMADVFEEEDEDSEGDGETRSEAAEQRSQQGEDSDGETTPPAGPKKALSLSDVPDATPLIVRRKSSGLSDKDQAGAHSVRTERSRTSLQEDVIAEEMPSVIFRTSNVFQSESNLSEPAAPSPKKVSSPREIPPVDLNTIHVPGPAAMPTSPYSMSHASSYTSPRSPMSVDAQRISTAPSSITDENSFHSLLMGEPGPEVRISVDYDIPSLTSSTSTMTRESAFAPNPRMSQPSLREQRPVSVSSAAFGRRRSSLVSLSRLISSSHGERSKLSMEVRLDSEPESRKKKSTTKRLGRMMQFWKPTKEGAPT